MEEINFREVFRENCYIPALRKLEETFSAGLTGDMERATEAFLSPLEAFLGLYLEHRDRGSVPPAGRLCLSFLRTSLCQGKPVLLAEVYETLPFLEKPVMGCELGAEWMLPGWDAGKSWRKTPGSSLWAAMCVPRSGVPMRRRPCPFSCGSWRWP